MAAAVPKTGALVLEGTAFVSSEPLLMMREQKVAAKLAESLQEARARAARLR